MWMSNMSDCEAHTPHASMYSRQFWYDMSAAYQDISAQVLHIQYDKLMPDWNRVDSLEAVEYVQFELFFGHIS